VRSFGVEERRARLAVRHHLTRGTGAAGFAQLTRDLVSLHATDPATVYLAGAARLRDPDIEAMQRALFDERTVVRMLGMRRTMFVVPVDLVGTVLSACTDDIAARERTRTVQFLEDSGMAGAGAWLRRVEEATVEALVARGEATAAELAADVPELQRQIVVGLGKKWEGRQGVSTRVLSLLGAEGRIVRGRPRGSWTSTQYRWAPMEAWLGKPVDRPPRDDARAALATRWLATFGPATVADVKWWTGWTLGETRRALARSGAVDVDLDGVAGIALPDDLEPVAATEPAASLLASLDPTAMGWTERAFYLGPHRAALFDRSGNVGPTVWWGGRIVGGWGQRPDRTIAHRLLSDIGADGAAAVEDAARRLEQWLGGVRVTPKFPTPLQRELEG
jgi:hypothetical protein